jgi:hypothetical protein
MENPLSTENALRPFPTLQDYLNLQHVFETTACSFMDREAITHSSQSPSHTTPTTSSRPPRYP